MEEILKELEKNIISIFDNNGDEISFAKKEIKMYKPKYSSTGRDSRILFLDDVPLVNTKKYKYKVTYKCHCGKEQTILLCKYLIKEKLSCPKCRENEEKIAWHKLYFEMKRNGAIRGHRDKSSKVHYDFQNENEEFKLDYFRRNLTESEFERAIKYVYSIDNVLIEGKDVKFIIAEPVFNAKKYSQSVLIDGIKHKLKNVYLKCPLCGEIFHITRQLKERIISNNFDCRTCALSNKTFAVKRINKHLTYQGQQELKFIHLCFDNNIEIVNGPNIPYYFEGKIHYYRVDFTIPKLKMLVEIKDNHIWHRKQVESGKWKNKENAAINFAKENNLTYHLIFSKDIEKFFSTMKRDSLNINEN